MAINALEPKFSALSDEELRGKTAEFRARLEKGETLDFWASKNGLDIRVVADLIDGKLKGTRGVPLENRRKMETVFGQIFDD